MRTTIAALGIALVTLAGCQAVEELPGQPQQQASPPDRGVVQLQIFQGPEGSTMAFIPIFIGDEGPFPFALDTGASISVIDQDLARRLNLESEGTIGRISGVVGTRTARAVRVPEWRAGDVELPGGTIASLQLGDEGGDGGLAGLLGSDVLSDFGTITVDYEDEIARFAVRGSPSPSP